MAFLFFKSKKERARKLRKERRQAYRQAENAVLDVKDRIKRMEKDASAEWQKAREAFKEGQQATAQRALTSYRAAQVLMTKLEQKRWVFEQYLIKMEVAQSDNQFAEALGQINKIIHIDPERVEDVFGAAQDALGEQLNAERFWNKMYENEMAGASGSLQDHIPSMEEMASELEQQVAAEIGGAAAPASADKVLDDRISAGQQRVKDLLSGK